MRILRVGVVLGLAFVSACGTSDQTSQTIETTATPAIEVPATIGAETTEPPVMDTSSSDSTPVPTPDSAPTTTAPVATDPVPTESPTSAPDTTPATLVEVKLYLLRDERLARVRREVAGPAVLHASLAELLAGPTADELEAGLHSEVPADTALLAVALDEGVATVDLDSQFEAGGGSLSMSARIAQVVFTATQFDNVDNVRFLMNGAPIEFLGGEGIVLTEPQTRSSVDRAFTGGIIIDTPTPGEIVSSPIIVSGEGDVFEADFPIEVWRDGEKIGGVAPVMAGAWGNWADFETAIILDVPSGPIELIASDEGGCGDAPECPPTVRTVVPLVFAG